MIKIKSKNNILKKKYSDWDNFAIQIQLQINFKK